MASKFKTKVEKYSRPDGKFVEYDDKSITFENSKDESFVKAALSVMELLMRGYKVSAYEDTDREAIRVDIDLKALFQS
jgi:hypothetical protein